MNATSPPVCLDDYEHLARHKLDANAWAYIAGGAADEVTVGWNRSAFNEIRIVPRVLRRATDPSARIELLGRTLAHPILVAPLSYQRLAHPQGEIATAMAAAAQEACMVLSTLSSTAMENVVTVGPACRWFQLYMQPSREHTKALAVRAEAAGFEAIVATVDAPLNGVRNREHRAGFRLPTGVSAVHVADLQPPPQVEADGNGSLVFPHFLQVAPSWDDIAWLKQATTLPIIIKGIASAEDAELALAAGAAGVVVSNHGGRTLDTVPATIELLPEVVEMVAGRVPVLVDGGIRRGSDVFKALALGASAVMIGRPILHGLAVAGAMGVSHVLRLLRDELEITMALAGCMTVGEISRAHVRC